jgi:hypothetical protein
MGPDIAHDVFVSAVELIPIPRNGLGVFDHPIVNLRHAFVQAPHSLELFLQE